MSTVIDEIFKAIMVMVVLGCVGWYLAQQMTINAGLVKKISDQNQEITQLKLENVDLADAMKNMENQFAVLTDLTEEQRKNLVATKLSERLTDTNSELNSLKEIMLQTPEKAIKLERLQIKQEAEFEILKTKIESLKDQFSTLLSLLAVLVSFIVGLLLYIWRQAHSATVHNQSRKADA